ncbi:hypothetical protein RF55_2042, partial [Lasius niger]
MEFVIACSFTK